jgi:hypothetical protein
MMKTSDPIHIRLILLIVVILFFALGFFVAHIEPLVGAASPTPAVYAPIVAKGLTCLCDTPTPTNTPIPCGIGQCQSNPVPHGASYLINDNAFSGSISLTVKGYERPTNRNPIIPSAGYENIAIEVSAKCMLPANQTCRIGASDFGETDSLGIVNIYSTGSIQGGLPYTQFFGGSTASGWIGFQINQTVTNVLLLYPWHGPPFTFFATQ